MIYYRKHPLRYIYGYVKDYQGSLKSLPIQFHNSLKLGDLSSLFPSQVSSVSRNK